MASNLMLSYSGWFFIFPVPALASVTWMMWLKHLLVKTKAKKASEYLSFLDVPGNHISCFLLETGYFFRSLPFVTDVPTEAFLVALYIPGYI